MRRVVIDMQNTLFADAVAEALRRFDSDFDPVMSESPDKTLVLCNAVLANILIMEVSAYAPWKLEERMKIREWLYGQNLYFRWGLAFGLVFTVLVFGVYGHGYDAAGFIYMQY